MKFQLPLLAALLCMPAVADTARPRVDRTIDLNEAITIALKESPVLRGASAEVDMAAARVQAARAAKSPTLSATGLVSGGSETGSIFSTPAPVMPQNLMAAPRGAFGNANLFLMVPLGTGGRLQALTRQAIALNSAAGADAAITRLDLILEVKTAYRQAWLARALAEVARDRAAATAERITIDRAAVATGRLPELYVLSDEAEDATARQGVLAAERDIELSLLDLKAALGVDLDSQMQLAPLEASADGAATDATELVKRATAQRPELAAARARLEAAGAGRAAAASAFKPQIAAMAMADANRMRTGDGGAGASAGLVLGIPLFDGGARRAAVDEAGAAQRAATQELARQQIVVELQVRRALAGLAAARASIAAARSGLTAATENYRVAKLRYESGRSTNVEVLDALAAASRARSEVASAAFQLGSAQDQLERATGAP